MTKETLLKILDYSKEKDIPEKDAAYQLIGKRICLNAYKKKCGIERYKPGESKHSWGKRKKIINDDFFSKLTLENCYYAGFIAADGNIDKNKTKLTITLSGKDKSFLDDFNKRIKSNYKVTESITKGKFTCASLSVNSKKICDDLNKNFNITPQKSLTLVPPNINDKLLLDSFIIGVIDGDGTIGYAKSNNSKRFYISIIGTKEMILMIKCRFEEILEHKTSELHHRKEHSDNTFTLRVSDASARKLFLHFYNINVPKLERKWGIDKYEYCINFKKALPICRRKGVNVFNLKGELIKSFNTLKEASEFTNVTVGRISTLCKYDNNEHMAKGFMFSRTKNIMNAYCQNNPFVNKITKYINEK